MAYQRNDVHLVGRLTAAPELKKVGDSSVANFTLAINYKDLDDKPRGEFFDCDVWGGWAENLVKTAKKGSLVAVYGRLRQEKWTDKETQKGRSKIVVCAEAAYHVRQEDFPAEVGPGETYTQSRTVSRSEGESGTLERKEFTDQEPRQFRSSDEKK